MPRLIIYEDSEEAETIFETFELSDSSILIGSAPDNHLVLKTSEIDPSHASLELRDHEWILQDLGGPGGTAVNGQTIEGPHSLYHDDLIELGSIKMRFQDPERAVTREFLASVPQDAGEQEDEPGQPEEAVQLSGRVWFATVATATIAVIFIIIFLLIFAQFLGLINIGGLVSP